MRSHTESTSNLCLHKRRNAPGHDRLQPLPGSVSDRTPRLFPDRTCPPEEARNYVPAVMNAMELLGSNRGQVSRAVKSDASLRSNDVNVEEGR
jgi:hypothetical protein